MLVNSAICTADEFCHTQSCPASSMRSTDGTGCLNLAHGWTSGSSSIDISHDLYCHMNFWNPSSNICKLNVLGTGSPFSYTYARKTNTAYSTLCTDLKPSITSLCNSFNVMLHTWRNVDSVHGFVASISLHHIRTTSVIASTTATVTREFRVFTDSTFISAGNVTGQGTSA